MTVNCAQLLHSDHASRTKRSTYFAILSGSLSADNLAPQLDKLVTSQLGLLAQRRLARGVRLNHAEATVCLAWQPTNPL